MASGYKVVRLLENGTYWSMSINNSGCTPVEYRIGEKTIRPSGCGPLCVFEDLQTLKEEIKDFGYYPHLRIFTCEYQPSNDFSVWNNRSPYRALSKWILPFGTTFADTVTLLKEI